MICLHHEFGLPNRYEPSTCDPLVLCPGTCNIPGTSLELRFQRELLGKFQVGVLSQANRLVRDFGMARTN